MAVSASDIKFRKSEVVTNTSANGGRKGQIEITSGMRHNLFPRVTKAERDAGVTRYRKEFLCNDNADDIAANDVLVFLEFPSNGGDRFAIGNGSQTGVQSDLTTSVPVWTGVGSLHASLSSGESQVQLAMESNDFVFPNNGYLHLSNKFETGQTIDADVSIGNSVEYSAGTWFKIAAEGDIAYPKGLYVGSNTVMTIKETTGEEWIAIQEYKYTDEDIGDGDGSDTSPVLISLLHGTNGICSQASLLPIVTATCGASAQTVNIDKDGNCSGYCSAGKLNMSTGVWTTDITWTSAPDVATDITITYYENCFSYTGNVATIFLDGTVANAYETANSYGAGCIFESEITPAISDWVETSVAGSYDESTYPLVLFNDGTEYDSWTVTFTSAIAFTVSGANEGSVGTGGIAVDFEPTNANTGQPYFKIDKDGWAGTWATGETVTFKTYPAAIPIWWREIVPALTSAVADNLCVLGFYSE